MNKEDFAAALRDSADSVEEIGLGTNPDIDVWHLLTPYNPSIAALEVRVVRRDWPHSPVV